MRLHEAASKRSGRMDKDFIIQGFRLFRLTNIRNGAGMKIGEFLRRHPVRGKA